MAKGEYIITEMFEQAVAEYTGADYAVAVDNCSNALFLCLMYEGVQDLEITIPKHTYMSVPNAIKHAGAKVKWFDGHAVGAYQLKPTRIWDSALRFTANMYISSSLMCLSFTGPRKRLRLGKGGMILTDDRKARDWFKKARFSGRNEKDYSEDSFDMLGWNFYMLPELATHGLMLIRNFYELDGTKKTFDDIDIPYPDLSKFKVYET